MNLSDYKGILVFAEQRDGKIQNVALELLGKARELAESIDTKTVSAVLIGENVKGLADELVQYGADVVYVVEGPEYKDRKSTRLNSSHANISYAVFCLKKKN